MSKLSELASLLRQEKQKLKVEQPDVVQETVVDPESIPVVEAIAPVTISEPVPEKPQPDVSQLHLKMLQADFQNLKKIVEQSANHAKYIPTWSGGGADSMTNIDRPVKTISSNYTPTTRDWYIGVSHAEIVTITLPTTIQNGREYVIKDESGYAHLVPIRIAGTIDGNVDGVELKIPHGSITVLYNNGWRII